MSNKKQPKEEPEWCDISNFLIKNEMLIYVLADRILNGLPYDSDDIKMEAAVAYYETLKYINSFKKTKMTTAFTWFYQKRLYAKKKNDNTCILSDKKKRFFNARKKNRDCIFADGMFNCNEFNRLTEEAIASSVKAVRYYHAPAIDPVSNDGNLHLCIRSFAGRVSMKVYRALIIISSSSDTKHKKKALRNLFKCSSSDNIEKTVRFRIEREIKESGVNLYIAVYLNGSINRMIVCAGSEEEARKHIIKYGELIEIKTLW